MDLKQYSEKHGHGFVRALSRATGAHEPDVSRWVTGKRPVPVRYGVAIEQFTGGAVTRQELFPATWQRIWPELASLPPATAPAPLAQGAEQGGAAVVLCGVHGKNFCPTEPHNATQQSCGGL